MGLIEEFIARYTKEYDFYEKAARRVSQQLERDLRAAGVRCIVSHRAKDIARLEEKCRQRAAEKEYASVADIFRDIVDLAGVRVALYFPGQRDQVDKTVTRLFRLEKRKAFPENGGLTPDKRFSGYSAVHYRVRLKEEELSDLDKRYSTAYVEIQVASVLMHAWSEVEHDLIYKPLGGDLSEQELAVLDQLNGLVIAGEISLKMLQQAGEQRVASAERDFVNHYELAAHLLGHANEVMEEPVQESGLGRIDALFGFLTRLGKTTPSDLEPYLASLHGNTETRPLADQVMDMLLAEDSDRYESLGSVHPVHAGARRPTTATGRGAGKAGEPGQAGETGEEDIGGADSFAPLEAANSDYLVGRFLTSWIELERLVRGMSPPTPAGQPMAPLAKLLRATPELDPATHREIGALHRVRNYIVHGRTPLDVNLAEVIERVQAVTARLRDRLSDG
ncbi:GTP pyrophosphokinase family protein [Streptomyces sp. NPDC057638]|uniref:GTP pyrophosphokinase n=1 Tax=Streptomyces sp. NPDC057638 TaxID=3346190 RepID=UPI0036B480FA